MTLLKLIIIVTVIAVLLSALNIFVLRKNKNVLITLLQNFCGVLFIISGYVKAIDPLGTAYKMVDYFAEFESTFADTWFGFLAPIFPALSDASVVFSVFMIVLEIVLGVMLIIGYQRKLTAWLFLIIILFFSFLTGFTYLTGYVPEGVNFFEFSQWGPYVKSNMKVTDCGCFGDFLKLEPKISFFKDIFLLIPAVLFVFFHKQMFQLLDNRRGFSVAAVATILFVFFCLRNFVWDLPVNDFRPFKEGVNVAERRALEAKAMAEAPVSYPLVNKKTGEKVLLSSEELTKNYKNYPSEEWEYLEQQMGEPAIPSTKISEFQVSDLNGDDITESILENKGPSLMIVAYKMKGEVDGESYTVRDTMYTIDTLQSDTASSPVYIKRFQEIVERQAIKKSYSWDKDYQLPWLNAVVPFANQAAKNGLRVYAITKLYEKDRVNDFANTVQADFPFYLADDILLKTIIRSNPGVVYIEDATIVKKWHHKQLPSFESFKNDYLNNK